MPGTADGDVVSRWQALGESRQCPSWGGQTSRCCMVCLMSQSQVSGSLGNPHFNMFTLDRPTCVRNRLSAFQVVQGFSAPTGRRSSALMSRCTLASRGSSRSLHSSKRAAFAVVLMGLVHVIKLFRDLRRGTTPRCPLTGCLSSLFGLLDMIEREIERERGGREGGKDRESERASERERERARERGRKSTDDLRVHNYKAERFRTTLTFLE